MKNEIENHIRGFGMSGYLVTDELQNVEAEYALDLGHVPASVDQTTHSFYSQFEQSVRAEAADMATHYETFYCLEKSIRKVITEALDDSEGSGWWTSQRIPDAIKQAVDQRAKKEVDSGVTRRSEQPIDYTTFGELSVIITKNWDIFGAIFTSKRAVENVMAQLNLLRGPIAHCSPITADEIDRLNLAVKDWFRIMA